MDITKAAQLLLEAYRTGMPIDPLTQTFGDFTLEQACQIQLLPVESWRQAGRVIKGHKVGLMSCRCAARWASTSLTSVT